MNKEELEKEYRDYLESLPLGALRVLGREKGVPTSRCGNKPDLVAGVTDVLMGRQVPVPRSGRGAPVKQSYLDPTVPQKLAEIKRRADERERRENFSLQVNAPEGQKSASDQDTGAGILEIMPSGYGFLRSNNCQPSANGDVFIAAPVIHALRLREGDFVTCSVKPKVKNDSAAIGEVISVNGLPRGRYEQRPLFDALTATYANEKIVLSDKNCPLSLRMLDLFAPVGKGQRALIIAPPKAGKTTLLKDVAHAVSARHEDISLIVLLIDERPEEVTDFRMSLPGAEIVYSTFDEGADHHVRAAELTIAHAKRMAEQGKDVVILLDSLTKLTRAYNYVTESTGKTLSGGLDAGALAGPKRFFGAARNTLEAGSITILATALVDTGSRMDDVIYEEFKGTGNADVFLSRELAERRIFPAIDVRRSGTRREEALLTRAELSAVYQLRERGLVENVEGIIDMLRKTDTNEEFVSRLGEWLRVYKAK